MSILFHQSPKSHFHHISGLNTQLFLPLFLKWSVFFVVATQTIRIWIWSGTFHTPTPTNQTMFCKPIEGTWPKKQQNVHDKGRSGKLERNRQTHFCNQMKCFLLCFGSGRKEKRRFVPIVAYSDTQLHQTGPDTRDRFSFSFAGLLWIAILIIRSKIWKVFHFANVFPAFSRFWRHGKSCFGRKKKLTLWGNCFFPQNKSQTKPKDAKPEIHHKKFSVCDSEMSLTAGPWIEFQPNNTFTVLC